MYVCLCQGISDRDIKKAIAQGHTTLGDLLKYFSAGRGPGCGACHPTLRKMLAQAQSEKSPSENKVQESADTLFVLASTPTNG